MTSRGVRYLLALFLLTLCVPLPDAVANDEPEIVIEWPNEDETVYAGPSSLLFRIPIKGYVEGHSTEHATVRLEIFRDGANAGRYTTVLRDHRFEFLATVNPHGSRGGFPAELGGCAQECHLPGNFVLPAGQLLLRISLVTEGRTVATAERHAVVDLGRPATIPVEIRLAEDPQQVVHGVRVGGSTRLYLYRTRHFVTENEGSSPMLLEVEALSEASTDYLLRVRPTVVDGVLYEGVDEATVHLPASATISDLVTLYVRVHLGQVTGEVHSFPSDSDLPCTIHAIALPDGATFSTDVAADGTFSFSELPIDQYRVVLDELWLAERGRQSTWRDVNLTAGRKEVIRLPLSEKARYQVEGQIVDGSGQPLPFSWVGLAGEEGAFSGRIDGHFRVATSAADTVSLTAWAPGYYSQAHVVTVGDPHVKVLSLVQRPEMRSLSWGDGELLLPPESKAEVVDRDLSLHYGWLWGQGASAQPYRIYAGEATIELTHGRFALEYFPGRQAWFYLLDGEATVRNGNVGRALTVHRQQMVNLHNNEGLKVVRYNPAVVSALGSPRREPPGDVWEPTLRARLRDRLALLGISMAQVVTFITYSFILLSLGVSPIFALYYLRRRRKQQRG